MRICGEGISEARVHIISVMLVRGSSRLGKGNGSSTSLLLKHQIVEGVNAISISEGRPHDYGKP